MKKLLLIFATLLISLNSMALSFPRSAYGQQRTLNKVTVKAVTLTEVEALKSSLMTAATIQPDEEAGQESLVEMLASYIIDLFTNRLFQNKSVAVVNTFEKERCEYFAIKQDFDYRFIG